MTDASSQSTPVIIKKYANRRLYNTETSSYITLDHLAQMVRDNREFKVVDAKSGDDITRSVLTQIIVEEETRGQTMLPISFLRQLISMYGDSLQSMVPQYLEASMDAFRRNQEQFRKAMEGAFNPTAFGSPAFKPFEQLAKQNMAMFEAAAGMFSGRAKSKEEAQKAETPEKTTTAGENSDLADLKAQLANLQLKLDRLSSR